MFLFEFFNIFIIIIIYYYHAIIVFTKFKEPAFSVRVEEGVCQIIPIILRYFERLVADALIQFLIRKELNSLKKFQGEFKLPVKILMLLFTIQYMCKDRE